MLGFSGLKILTLLVILAGVWFVFSIGRRHGRKQGVKQGWSWAQALNKKTSPPKDTATSASSQDRHLIQCPHCRIYHESRSLCECRKTQKQE